MEKVLVTGGAGYVGSVVVAQLLKAGYSVRVMDNLIYGGASVIGFWQEDNFEFVFGDVSEEKDCETALEGVHTVVHLAAIVGDPACSLNQELARRVNLDGTRKLTDLTREMSVKKFIFASTCSNYGISDPEAYVTEDNPLNPVSLYAETKVEAEKYLLQSTSEDFSPTILRFATVYGASPRMRFDLLINDFVKDALTKNKLVVYGEQFWRPYIHVKDVAAAILTVLKDHEQATKSEIFNVGDTSQNFQKKTIAQLIQQRLPDTTIEYVVKEEDPRSYKVSFEKIRSKLGFRPSKIVQDGIEEIVRILNQRVISDVDSVKYTNSVKLS